MNQSEVSKLISAGTQVVTLIDIRGPNGARVHPRGAVGIVTRTPTGTETHYLVRFPDGFEKSLTRDQLEILKHFKDRLGAPSTASARPPGAPDPVRRTTVPVVPFFGMARLTPTLHPDETTRSGDCNPDTQTTAPDRTALPPFRDSEGRQCSSGFPGGEGRGEGEPFPPLNNSGPAPLASPGGEGQGEKAHNFPKSQPIPSESEPPFDLEPLILYRCIVGSRAYGLDTDTSDTDLRGIYLAPAELHWSLFGAPEQFEDNASQSCYWELQKFIIMALKANPNILECLYSPLVEKVTPLAEELLALRPIFLSQMIFQTFNGYALSQFKKIEQDRRNQGEVRWKHAMHLLRLLLTGAATLREARVPVRVEHHRDRLLAIKRGELPWSEVDAWRQELHRDFERAFTETQLPERPDYELANEFLVRARREMANVVIETSNGSRSNDRSSLTQ